MVGAGNDGICTNNIKHHYHYGSNAHDTGQLKGNIDGNRSAHFVQPSFLHSRACFFVIGDKAPQQLAQKGNRRQRRQPPAGV